METNGRDLNGQSERPTVLAREWRRLVAAFGYSCAGLSDAVRTQASFRIDLISAIVLLPVALWLGRDWPERGFLVSTLIIVLFAEIVNSALEAVVDRIGLEYHELSKRAKDLGSAAVFLAIINWFVVWAAIVLDRFVLT